MIIQTLGTKGGTGKSTVAINVAAYLSKRRFDVACFDADSIKSLSQWSRDRDDNSNRKIPTFQRFGHIKKHCLEINKKHDYVVIDSSGRDSEEMRSGLLAADIAIIPIRVSQFDIDSLDDLESIITRARRLNSKLKICVLFSAVNCTVKELSEAVAVVKENYPNYVVLKSTVSEKPIYRSSIPYGLGVEEAKGRGQKDAAKEIQLLMREIFKIAKAKTSDKPKAKSSATARGKGKTTARGGKGAGGKKVCKRGGSGERSARA